MKPPYKPGDLIHPMTLQVKTPPATRNAAGEATPNWTDTGATVWAAMDAASGRDLYAGEQVKVEVTHKIVVNYPGIAAKTNRFVYGARTFDINWIKDIEERGEWFELLCKEVVL